MRSHELILGGAKSGKSRFAEERAVAWLGGGAARHATLLATALPGDGEMMARIARHRADRAARTARLVTVEAPFDLGATVGRLDSAEHLVVIDCLTLWLTQCLLPPVSDAAEPDLVRWSRERDELLRALAAASSPIVLVSNEVGLGVLPLSRAARLCVDELGMLHQAVARECARVTLMVAGVATCLKQLR